MAYMQPETNDGILEQPIKARHASQTKKKPNQSQVQAGRSAWTMDKHRDLPRAKQELYTVSHCPAENATLGKLVAA